MVFLIVSADAEMRQFLTQQLKMHFGELSEVLYAFNNFNASRFIINHSPAAILLDFRTPGPGVFQLVRNFLPSPARLYFMVQAAQNIALRAIQSGVSGIYDIPAQTHALMQDINRHLNLNPLQSVEKTLLELKNNFNLNQKILIHQNSCFHEVFANEIVYLQQNEKGLNLVLLHKSLNIHQLNIETILVQLSGSQFCRFGKNLVVNLNRIEKLVQLTKGCYLYFENETSLELAEEDCGELPGLFEQLISN